jgi:hypothetical protein
MFTSYRGSRGGRKGKGEAACTVVCSFIVYVTSEKRRFSKVCYQQSLVRQGRRANGAYFSSKYFELYGEVYRNYKLIITLFSDMIPNHAFQKCF